MSASRAHLASHIAARFVSAILFTAAITAACADSPNAPPAPPRLEIRASQDTFNALGDTGTVSVVVVSGNTSKPPTGTVRWQSLSNAVSIDQSGRVISWLVGSARVVATADSLTDTLTLVVRQVPARITPVWAADTIFVDDTITTAVKGLDSNGVAIAVLQETPRLAQVTGAAARAEGRVLRAVAPGEVRATVAVGAVTADVVLTVETPWTTIAAGSGWTCGLVVRRAVYCWGSSAMAQGSRPTPVAGLADVVELDAGVNHACARTTLGDVSCWGRAWFGFNGVERIALPAPAVQVTSGYDFSCALLSSGASYCWGWNQDGQLGVGPTGPGAASRSPVRTSAPMLSSISAGTMQTCGISAGGLICWGQGIGSSPIRLGGTATFSRVSVGTGICALTPENRPTCLTGYTGIVGISTLPAAARLSTGDGWGCVVLTDGSAWCWGSNYYGELGRGTRMGDVGLPQSPAPVAGGLTFTMVSTGTGPGFPGRHSCGVTTDGKAHCWGENTLGQLGSAESDQVSNYRMALVPVRVTRHRRGVP